MNARAVEVGTWVAIQDGCPIKCQVAGNGSVEFRCGHGTNAFDFEFGSEALREFLRVAGEALAGMDA